MTSLERVLATMEHEQPDRIPFDLGSSLVTGITKNAYVSLAGHLGVETGEVELCDTIQQLPVLSDQIAELLEVDVRGVVPNFARKNPPLTIDENGARFTDEYGVTWTMPTGALYFDVADSPFAGDIGVTDVEEFPWPDPSDPALIDGLEAEARAYHEQGYAVILDSLCAGLFEMCCRVRGYEQFYADLAMEPELAHALLERFVEQKIGFYRLAAEKLGPYVQFVREGDDMAGQESLLMSPRMYGDFMKPKHKRLFDAQKELFPPPFYCFFHSDGAIMNLLPHFVEIGVDILNPVQLTAQGMDADVLKREFGRDLVFWGGGVNTQGVLPHGTPAEVAEDVRRRIRQLGPGGGYVFGTVHNIQDDVSPENVMAMLQAFRELREY